VDALHVTNCDAVVPKRTGAGRAVLAGRRPVRLD
jgi:hypothetical protein